MLEITAKGGQEFFDEETGLFHSLKQDEHLKLEHSLISISKWESQYHRSFISEGPKTNKEQIDYIKDMSMTSNVDPEAFYVLSSEDIEKINAYIADPMTATTFSDNRKKASDKYQNQKMTSEVIYYLMISFGIPFECQKWHLNRLLMLIRVCEYKNGGTTKMSKAEIFAQNKALNEARRAKLHSKG